jgi:hypothetical protein
MKTCKKEKNEILFLITEVAISYLPTERAIDYSHQQDLGAKDLLKDLFRGFHPRSGSLLK